MRRRKRIFSLIVVIIIVKFMWNSAALVDISLDDEKTEQDKIESVSPEVKIKRFSSLKSQVPRKIAKLPEPTLVPWLKKGPVAKQFDDDSSPRLIPKAPYKELFERIKQNAQATAFSSEMNMESLNVYYRSPPSCIERRDILRDYVAMWKKDISDSSIQNFVSPRIKFFTAETPSTQIEAQNNEDLILVKYVAAFNNVKCEEEIFENNKNDSHFFDQGTCFLVLKRYVISFKTEI